MMVMGQEDSQDMGNGEISPGDAGPLAEDPDDASFGQDATYEDGEDYGLEGVAPTGKDWFRVFLVSVASEVIPAFFLSMIMQFMRRSRGIETPATMADLAPVLVVSSICACIGTVWASYHFVCRKYNRTFREGLLLLPVSGRTVMASVGWAILLIAAYVAFSLLFLGSEAGGDGPLENGKSVLARILSKPQGVYAFMFIALIMPFAEEVYYRGVVFPMLQAKWRTDLAIVVTVLWFTAIHVFQLAGDWYGLIGIFALSLVTTNQRSRYGSLTPSLITHCTYNLILVLLTFLALVFTPPETLHPKSDESGPEQTEHVAGQNT